MEGPILLNGFPTNDIMTTNTFWRSPVCYVQSSPNWKSEMLGKWVVRTPSHCAHPCKKSVFFFVSHVDSFKIFNAILFNDMCLISFVVCVCVCVRWVGITNNGFWQRIGLVQHPSETKHRFSSPFSPVKVENSEGVHSKCVACHGEGLRTLWLVVLLMAEILHHLVCKNPTNNGKSYLSTGAGFQPSKVVYTIYIHLFYLGMIKRVRNLQYQLTFQLVILPYIIPKQFRKAWYFTKNSSLAIPQLIFVQITWGFRFLDLNPWPEPSFSEKVLGWPWRKVVFGSISFHTLFAYTNTSGFAMNVPWNHLKKMVLFRKILFRKE